MYVVLGNGYPGGGVSWWGPFEDLDQAEAFIEGARDFLDCLRVELLDPCRFEEIRLPARSGPR